jgi:NADPH-dependent 2,4-dienoyl-CoA reductase/sulfur reductase-like enzyme
MSTRDSVDEVERRRREVEAARADLARSVEQLSGKAVDTRDELREKIIERAVPIAVGVAGLLLARAIRRRRKRPRPLIEAGPFVLLERR